MLVGARDAEVSKNHDKHEDVVHRKRLLDHEAGEKFQRGLVGQASGLGRDGERFGDALGGEGVEQRRILREFPLHVMPEAEAENQGQRDPHHAPRGGLLDRHLVGLAVKHAQIEGEHAEHEEREQAVEPPVVGERKKKEVLHGRRGRAESRSQAAALPRTSVRARVWKRGRRIPPVRRRHGRLPVWSCVARRPCRVLPFIPALPRRSRPLPLRP